MSKELEETIAELSNQHKLFIPEELDLNPKFSFFRLFYRPQVDASQVWQVYRDGVFYAQLKSGPHALWNAIWHKWRAQKVNLRIVQLHYSAKGRVRGPTLPLGETTGVASMDLGCSVTVAFELSCKISDIEKFLQFEDPLSAFSASLNNMVHEMIGRLPYDQYGEWATALRNFIKDRIQGGINDAERHIGIRVEDVFVTKVEPNSETDRNMIAMYRQVERVRRELAEAQANRQRDTEVAQSFSDQGNILNISPAILALQNSPVGKELIERDSHLREMMVAAGLNPGVSVQPLRDPQAQLGGQSPSVGYLNPPRSNPPQTYGMPAQGGYASGSLPNFVSQSGPMSPFPPNIGGSGTPPIDTSRQTQELAALNTAGFICAGTGQLSPVYDSYGQPVPGSMEWVLEVYVQRTSGYLTIVFHCPAGYPTTPPRVQIRTSNSGGLNWIIPNTINTWNTNSSLAEVVREIDNITV